jgi:hypothetical protein
MQIGRERQRVLNCNLSGEVSLITHDRTSWGGSRLDISSRTHSLPPVPHQRTATFVTWQLPQRDRLHVGQLGSPIPICGVPHLHYYWVSWVVSLWASRTGLAAGMHIHSTTRSTNASSLPLVLPKIPISGDNELKDGDFFVGAVQMQARTVPLEWELQLGAKATAENWSRCRLG